MSIHQKASPRKRLAKGFTNLNVSERLILDATDRILHYLGIHTRSFNADKQTGIITQI